MHVQSLVLFLFSLLIFLVALICLWVLLIAYHTQIEVRRVAHEINSRMDQLLDARGKLERAAGRAEME
jgi:hypothetical protein